MKKMRHWLRYSVLFVLGLAVVTSSSLGWASERAFGQLDVVDYQILRDNGRVVDFSVYRLRTLTYGQPMPAILTIHGISGSRGTMEAFNIELARRNFTVVSVDLAGHGVSSERFGFASFDEVVKDAYEAVRYVQLNDPETDDALYGILGHSLGAGIALYFQDMPILPAATVVIGGGMGQNFGGVVPEVNETHPYNLLLASGLYDELITPETALDTLRTATGQSEAVEGVVYGDFSAGTARKLVLSATNHLFEMSDPTLVTQSVDWLVRSLQGQLQAEAFTLSPSYHIYQYKSVAGTVGTIAFVLSIFPLYLIVYTHIPPRLRPLRGLTGPEPAGSRLELGFSTGLGLISSVLLLVFILMGFGLDFSGISIVPISFGTGFALYSIVGAAITVRLVRRYAGIETVNAHAPHLTKEMRGMIPREMLKSFILLIPVVLWTGLWTVTTEFLFGTRAGFTLPTGGASLVRLGSLVVLMFLLWPLFYGDKVWLDTVTSTDFGWRDYLSLGKTAVSALVHRLLGLLLLLALLYVPFLAGAPFGFVMFIALLVLVFVPIMGLTVLLSVWIGGITGNDLATSLVNALLLALVIASTFQILG